MATLAALAAGVAGTGLALRFSLRSAQRNGARLNPLLQAIAGTQGGAAGKDQWVKGGFAPRMDRKEAVEILGLRCVSLPSPRPTATRARVATPAPSLSPADTD